MKAARAENSETVLFDIVHEDSDMLVVNKPAGLVCHPTKGDEYSSLISRVRLYLGPEIAPQLINRLDRETSGLTLLAKNLAVARELRRLWENRQVTKAYLAIVHGWLEVSKGVVEAPLGKDEQSRVAIKDCVRSDGVPARTEFRVERRFVRLVAGQGERRFSLVRVEPHTGRKHQIRIHLAHIGHPIVGDKLYGPNEDLYLALVEDRLLPENWRELIFRFHALHAQEVRFVWRGLECRYAADPEPWFQNFLAFPE